MTDKLTDDNRISGPVSDYVTHDVALFAEQIGDGYRFVCPGVMISGQVTEAYVPGVDGHPGWWALTQTVGDHTYDGASPSRVGAYLALIGDRYRLDVTPRELHDD